MSEEVKIEEQPSSNKMDWKKMFNYQWIVKNIPFFFFIATLTVLYIYNGHYADKMARNISNTEKHIKELEFDYKTIKSEVIYRSKASTLEEVVKSMGLKELTKPPIRLDENVQADSAKAD